jgi:hypothetical protein
MNAVRHVGSKVYIEGVPRMSWDTGEVCEFASALVRCMGCLDEPVDYHHVLGVSGVAFRFVLNRDIWDPGNYGVRNFTQQPNEPIHRACIAAGRKATVYECGRFVGDRENIITSIDNGIPVMAFGVVGPSDCVLITGYDSGGDVLLGWSTFQDIPDDHNIPHDSLGYFRKPDWHANTRGYVILSDRHEPAERWRIYCEALQLACIIILTPMLGDRVCGLRALEIWSQAMSDDANFDVDEAALGWRYLGLSINTTMLIDQLSAAPYLEEVAFVIPEIAERLYPAIEEYRSNAQTIAQARELIADDFSQKARERFRDSIVRKEYAALMQEIRERTETATYAMQDAIAHFDKLV